MNRRLTAPAAALGRVAIVGRGRMGQGLAAALARAGCDVLGPLGRGTDGGGADVVLLCVPDGQIAAAASLITPQRLVGHTSGATPLTPLAPHEAFSIHPLMTVTGADTSFDGAGCVIAGSTPRALETAAAIARLLGMRAARVAEEDRALYHAAASMASNYVVTLAGLAERLAAQVGIDRTLVAPLVRTAVENWAEQGAARALTGPIARGDEATTARQRAAVAARAPELVPVWDALAEQTRALARAGGAE
jgi:predicted short-subunit dehydrogenase-like oxidoreductase (DUF2520 family)